ncbi:auxiliary transport protein, MFP family, putative [Verrucomicrobiia bacterium DG1235]|nr:auxiliary transport protein, MFP family, putative [Verrucomicrobiae bacterium DG1235]
MAVLALLAGIALSGCSRSDTGTETASRPALPAVEVKVEKAVGQELPALIHVTGVVRASERASIAPKVMGTISAFPVDLGQRVKSGDLLVKIEAAEISAKVLQAEAQLKQASRDLAREESLLEKGASTSEIVKNLADRVTIMTAMVDEARVMLGYTEIRAPFDGRVARKFSEVGSLSAPGMPLLELEGDGDFEIEAGVPESLIAGLEVGAAFPVQLPSSKGSFEATLKEVSSAFDSISRTVTARFAIPAAVEARAGQYARLTLSGEFRPAVLAPVESVSKYGQMERVFVVEGGIAKLRLVKTGAARDGNVEIVSGLTAGETVVLDPPVSLRDGQPLKL